MRYKPGDKLCCISTQSYRGEVSCYAGKVYEIIDFRPGIGIDKRGAIKVTVESPFIYLLMADMSGFHKAFIRIKSLK